MKKQPLAGLLAQTKLFKDNGARKNFSSAFYDKNQAQNNDRYKKWINLSEGRYCLSNAYL